MKDHHLKAMLLSLGGYTAYACSDAIAKHLTMNGFSSFQVAAFYALTGILSLLLFSRRLGGAKSLIGTKQKTFHLCRAMLFVPGAALNFYAFSQLPMANVYTVLFMMPFLTAVLAHYILGEKTSVKIWLCIAVGFAGVLVANRPDIHHVGWPIIACITSVFCSGARNIIARRMGYNESAFSLSFLPCAAIFLIYLIPALSKSAPVDIYSLLLLISGGILSSAGTVWISMSLLQKVNLSLLTPFHYTQIVWGILFGMVFFANTPDFHTGIGCVLIIASGLALIRAKNKPEIVVAETLSEAKT